MGWDIFIILLKYCYGIFIFYCYLDILDDIGLNWIDIKLFIDFFFLLVVLEYGRV